MGPAERSVLVNGVSCRVWEKGRGEPVGFLAGLGGVVRWTPFLDALAERRRVIVPSLPGFPGGDGLEQLDDSMDWVAATLDLLEGAGLDGADLVGASVGGMLAAEVAALSRASVRRLVLIAPYGLFDAGEPTRDVFAVRPDEIPALVSAHPERFLERAVPGARQHGCRAVAVAARRARARQAPAPHHGADLARVG
jgi:pimeloyl-ACP methyl ester carboxylesterase